jgi:hypothetical protein
MLTQSNKIALESVVRSIICIAKIALASVVRSVIFAFPSKSMLTQSNKIALASVVRSVICIAKYIDAHTVKQDCARVNGMIHHLHLYHDMDVTNIFLY